MKDRLRKYHIGSRGFPLILAAACLISAAAAAWCVLFGFNRFSLSMELIGDEQLQVEYGDEFRDPGCRVRLRGSRFLRSGRVLDIPISVEGTVNTGKTGKYLLRYQVHYLGMQAGTERTVRMVDTRCPVITLTPLPEEFCGDFEEPGYAAYDNYDGEITDRVKVFEEPGRVTYTVLDSSGNLATAEREYTPKDITPPVITLVGGEAVTLTVTENYTEPGFTATDARDGDLTAGVTVTWEQQRENCYLPGTDVLRYTVSDSSGNEATVIRQVIYEPVPAPQTVYPTGKTIYLTFDDGPGPNTGRLLDVLNKYDVKATFFVVDTGYPGLLRRIVNEGHSIGVHSCSHIYSRIYSGADAYFSDLNDMQQVIFDATGIRTRLLRFPGGSSNLISRSTPGIMTELTGAVEAAGFRYFDWNVDSGDSDSAKTAAAVLKNVADGASRNMVSIVLQHDLHSWSVDAVESIILWGRNNGYTFLPLQPDSPGMHHTVLN